MAEKSPKPAVPRTHAGRRVTYGLNVTIAIVVAILIAGLVNYIGYNYLFQFRKDMTATGQYSLSPQSRKVIRASTEPVRIISLFSGSRNAELAARIERARGLVDEYGFVSSNVTVQHIDPAREPALLDAFYQTLRDRYADRLKPMDAAVQTGLQGVDQVQKLMRDQVARLTTLLEDAQMPQGKLPQSLQSITRVIAQQESDFGQYRSQIQQAMDRPLPDYTDATAKLATLLKMLDEGLFAQALRVIEPFTKDQGVPDAIRNELLALNDQFAQSRRVLAPLLETLAAAEPLMEYDELYLQLAHSNAVVLVGQDQVVVVTLEQMFKAADAGQEIREPQFLGEEKITGALLGMQQERMPMVVFVSSPQMPALGPQGMYQALASRLENMRFRVEEWSPQGRPGPMGQMMPPGDPPKVEPGQRAVWIILPIVPVNPMMPTPGGGVERVVSLMQERSAAGDGVLVMLAYSQNVRLGMPDLIVNWAQQWRINPLNDRMVLREQLLPDRSTVAQGVMQVTQWPAALPVTQALSGFGAVFAAVSPVEIMPAPQQGDDGLEVFPLVEVTGQGLWAERDPKQDSQLKPETAAARFIVAAAAQKEDGRRVVVVADPVWATDQFTALPAFPGNAELFVNSVYWLTGLEQMIAASARTQDIRRVGDLSPSALLTLKWVMMLGMPLGVGVVGMTVWAVRRRG